MQARAHDLRWNFSWAMCQRILNNPTPHLCKTQLVLTLSMCFQGVIPGLALCNRNLKMAERTMVPWQVMSFCRVGGQRGMFTGKVERKRISRQANLLQSWHFFGSCFSFHLQHKILFSGIYHKVE